MSKRNREQIEVIVRHRAPSGIAGAVLDVGSNENIVQLSPTEDAYEVQLHLRSPVGRVSFSGRGIRAAEVRGSDTGVVHELREMVEAKLADAEADLRGQMLVAILNSTFRLPTKDEVALQVVERVSVQLMEVVDRARKEPGR